MMKHNIIGFVVLTLLAVSVPGDARDREPCDERWAYADNSVRITAFDRLRDGGHLLNVRETQVEGDKVLLAAYIKVFGEKNLPDPRNFWSIPVNFRGDGGTHALSAKIVAEGSAHENISWYSTDSGDQFAEQVTLGEQKVGRVLVFPGSMPDKIDSLVVFLDERAYPLMEVRR